MAENALKFQPMPLWFRVWDKKSEEMYSDRPIDEVAKLMKIIGKDDVVICQDTGFKDKIGKSIYIGDIVRYVYSMYVPAYKRSEEEVVIGPAVYHRGEICLLPKDGDDHLPHSISLSKPDQLRVLGNIFENPELLGDKK